jgi:hypothetical protein
MSNGVSPMQPLSAFLIEESKVQMVQVYCSPAEAMTLTLDEAYALAVERDEKAAEALKVSIDTQLRLEKAAAFANGTLDREYSKRERRILAELGYAGV